jgi:hypothetical protein
MHIRFSDQKSGICRRLAWMKHLAVAIGLGVTIACTIQMMAARADGYTIVVVQGGGGSITVETGSPSGCWIWIGDVEHPTRLKHVYICAEDE